MISSEERDAFAIAGSMMICMKRRTRGLVYGMALFLVVLSLVYHTKSEKKEKGLNQEEIIWNTREELDILARIENRIVRAAQGKENGIPVSSSASGYESICPQMQTGQISEEKEANRNKEQQTVYLTFDDGPSRQTQKVLDILDKYRVKATFFVVSGNVTESGKEALKRAAEEGHTVGMHSDSHDYKKIYASVESLLKDYEKVFTMIQEVTGETPKIYRFPGGSYNSVGKSCIKKAIPEMERRGFVYFDWNVTAEDAVGTPTASSIKNNIFKNLEQTELPVILMHDGPCNGLTVEVLPEIIEELIQRGYCFDTLDHREPCYFNW